MENKNEKNYLHGRTPNKQKKKREIFLDFLLILWSNKQERKTEKKREIFLGFWSFSNTQEGSENKTNMDIQWKSMNTDNWNEYVNMNVMSVRNTYSPKLRLLA